MIRCFLFGHNWRKSSFGEMRTCARRQKIQIYHRVNGVWKWT